MALTIELIPGVFVDLRYDVAHDCFDAVVVAGGGLRPGDSVVFYGRGLDELRESARRQLDNYHESVAREVTG